MKSHCALIKIELLDEHDSSQQYDKRPQTNGDNIR